MVDNKKDDDIYKSIMIETLNGKERKYTHESYIMRNKKSSSKISSR